ncbi:hypothetical protein [Nocardia brasiliensis]|uniref:hypothetical protein n=1 Tax=Nocardia brasiliensis TaxID=37326 RepID=UPI00114C881D|nr:hypothetical protein [Nocardia brasiliensis]
MPAGLRSSGAGIPHTDALTRFVTAAEPVRMTCQPLFLGTVALWTRCPWTREKPFGKLSYARTAVIAVSCIAAAAAITVGAGPAQADSSTTVSPAGAGVTTANMGPVVFGSGASAVDCYTGTTSGGAVPAAPNNQNASGPVTVSLGTLTVSRCNPGEPDRIVEVTTTGTWTMVAQNGSPIAADLVIPQGGLTITTRGTVNCTTVYAPDEPATVAGTYTNSAEIGGLKSLPTVTVRDMAPNRTTGDASCPPGNSWGRVSATFIVNNPTDPGRMITVGP